MEVTKVLDTLVLLVAEEELALELILTDLVDDELDAYLSVAGFDIREMKLLQQHLVRLHDAAVGEDEFVVLLLRHLAVAKREKDVLDIQYATSPHLQPYVSLRPVLRHPLVVVGIVNATVVDLTGVPAEGCVTACAPELVAPTDFVDLPVALRTVLAVLLHLQGGSQVLRFARMVRWIVCLDDLQTVLTDPHVTDTALPAGGEEAVATLLRAGLEEAFRVFLLRDILNRFQSLPRQDGLGTTFGPFAYQFELAQRCLQLENLLVGGAELFVLLLVFHGHLHRVGKELLLPVADPLGFQATQLSLHVGLWKHGAEVFVGPRALAGGTLHVLRRCLHVLLQTRATVCLIAVDAVYLGFDRFVELGLQTDATGSFLCHLNLSIFLFFIFQLESMIGCKIVLIGDAGVGKTSFCRSCYAGEPQLHCTPTVGLDFHSILVNYSQGQVKCFLWDTAGQERFRSLVYVYYRNTHAVLCFYDVTSRSSFKNVKSW